jgi:hypothetical protein
MSDSLWAAGPAGGSSSGPTWLVIVIVIVIAVAVVFRRR